MKFSYSNILQLLDYEIDQNDDTTYLVFEFPENGNLQDFIK